jgi:hypothetical protein
MVSLPHCAECRDEVQLDRARDISAGFEAAERRAGGLGAAPQIAGAGEFPDFEYRAARCRIALHAPIFPVCGIRVRLAAK